MPRKPTVKTIETKDFSELYFKLLDQKLKQINRIIKTNIKKIKKA